MGHSTGSGHAATDASRLVIALILAILGCEGGGRTGDSTPDVPGTPTFASEIAPILSTHCAHCHQSGESAPFALVTYENARAYGPLIGQVTRQRTMPPWLPAPGCGEFAGARRLSDREIEVIQRWVEAGMPAGDLEGFEPPEIGSGEWELGAPDLVVRMPEPYALAAEGGDVFRNFVLNADIPAAAWVRAVELKVVKRAVVHHAVLSVDATDTSRRLDDEDPQPGFAGMISPGARSPERFFVGWAPGKAYFQAAPGMAWRLEAGSDLVLHLHLRPRGAVEAVSAELGFHLVDRPLERRPALLRLGSETLDIPARAADYVAEDSLVLPVDVDLLSLFPHAHFLAREMHASATLPNGTQRCLLRIERWDFDWQDEYRFVQPVALRRGTKLKMRYVYDNSAESPANAERVPRRVVFGPNATDEMGDLWIQVVPRDPGQLSELREQLVRKHLSIRAAGWEKLLQREPDRADVHLALAGALRGLARLEEAATHYRRALSLAPDAQTQLDLAETLMALGQTDSAVHHYRRTLDLRPSERRALYGLGSALADQGDLAQAMEHFAAAARAQPGWPDPLTAMAWTLATEPEFLAPQRAVELGERAAELTRWRDPAVLHVLAAAYASARQVDRAVSTAQAAFDLAAAAGEGALAATIEEYLVLYRSLQRP